MDKMRTTLNWFVQMRKFGLWIVLKESMDYCFFEVSEFRKLMSDSISSSVSVKGRMRLSMGVLLLWPFM